MDRMMDMDDYINSLTDRINYLEKLNESLRKEIRTQRKEIAVLKTERNMILDKDSFPGYDKNMEIV